MKIFYHQHVLELQQTAGTAEAKPLSALLTMVWHLRPGHDAVAWPEAGSLKPTGLLSRFLELTEGSLQVELAPGVSEQQFVESLLHKIEWVPAAGGLATTPEHELLMIYRNGVWDLPKGKIDTGESPPAAALREVEEETGAQHLALGNYLETSYHLYQHPRHGWCLKPTDWYQLHSPSAQALVGQAEEGITDVRWVPHVEWGAYADQCFPSIQHVLRHFIAQYTV
jgi:8-oxo-dGTP pyrophosphatase MutT (NUDIX family)